MKSFADLVRRDADISSPGGAPDKRKTALADFAKAVQSLSMLGSLDNLKFTSVSVQWGYLLNCTNGSSLNIPNEDIGRWMQDIVTHYEKQLRPTAPNPLPEDHKTKVTDALETMKASMAPFAAKEADAVEQETPSDSVMDRQLYARNKGLIILTKEVLQAIVSKLLPPEYKMYGSNRFDLYDLQDPETKRYGLQVTYPPDQPEDPVGQSVRTEALKSAMRLLNRASPALKITEQGAAPLTVTCATPKLLENSLMSVGKNLDALPLDEKEKIRFHEMYRNNRSAHQGQ